MNKISFVAAVALAALSALAVEGQQCQLDTNPNCAIASNLGTTSGDKASTPILRTGLGEAYFLVRLREDYMGTRALGALVELAVPAGVDYDLAVRCLSCTNSALKVSTASGSVAERIFVTRADTMADNGLTILVEIRYRTGTSCATWTLRVTGNPDAVSSPLACPN